MILKTYSSGFPENKRVKNPNNNPEHPMFKVENDHDPIISSRIFDAVQAEKIKRSNVVEEDSGAHRSAKKYSSKKKIKSF